MEKIKNVRKKYLYCKFCGEYPDLIKEVYNGRVTEIRKWGTESYEYFLVDSNMESLATRYLCGKCDSPLRDTNE